MKENSNTKAESPFLSFALRVTEDKWLDIERAGFPLDLHSKPQKHFSQHLDIGADGFARTVRLIDLLPQPHSLPGSDESSDTLVCFGVFARCGLLQTGAAPASHLY